MTKDTSPSLEFSVVIPTCNRFDKLIKVLQSLVDQSYPTSQYEVIVVDDGSTESLYRDFCTLNNRFPQLDIKTIHQVSSGAAVARNLGIASAQGKYILFLGDDTRADPNLLDEHAKAHQDRENISVLGFVEWEQTLNINALMRFIAPYGPQFDYRIKNPQDCGYRRFYTSNISVPRKSLQEEVFDRRFPGCNWEDIDLGYRLEKRGMRIVYNPKAIVYHDHAYDEEAFIRRQRSVGRNKTILFYLHPELKTFASSRCVLRMRLLMGKVLKHLGKFTGNKYLYYRGVLDETWLTEFLKGQQDLVL